MIDGSEWASLCGGKHASDCTVIEDLNASHQLVLKFDVVDVVRSGAVKSQVKRILSSAGQKQVSRHRQLLVGVLFAELEVE